MQIFLWAGFEEKFIFPLLKNISDFYLRLIDDILLIRKGTKNYECNPSVEVEYEMPKTEINFLDNSLFKVDNKLQTKVCVKPTD